MADLEAVLADVSYLMAMEKSKCTPAARASKKIVLPDPSVRSVMVRYMEKLNEIQFDKIFNQRLGYLLFRDFCQNVVQEQVPQFKFYEEIKKYEKLDSPEERKKKARDIYDTFVMRELLSNSNLYSKTSAEQVQKVLSKSDAPQNLFEPYVEEIFAYLRGDIFSKFVESEKFTRFCQWKNLELNIQLSMNDFSVHRIIGRGGFGEVYGCRKADTGKMYAMKCLDKKRIKMKQGETLALNERIMLSLVSTGQDCPFIVCMTYAFHTADKLCFILDLMNGGDLHYHLSQHGVFNENEMKFYAAEVILGLEHMHRRFIVYRSVWSGRGIFLVQLLLVLVCCHCCCCCCCCCCLHCWCFCPSWWLFSSSLQGPEAGEHFAGRTRPRPDLRLGSGLRLQQKEASRVRRHPRLHGAGGAEQGHRVRLLRGLVLLRLHAVQVAKGPLALPAAQDEGQARNRQDDPDHERGAAGQLLAGTQDALRGTTAGEQHADKCTREKNSP